MSYEDGDPYDDDRPARASTFGIRYEESVIAQRLIGAAMRDPDVMRDLLALHVETGDMPVSVLERLWETCVAIFKEIGRAEPMLVESSLIAQGEHRDDVRDIMANAIGMALDDTSHKTLARYVDHMRRRVANRRLVELGERIAREAAKEGAQPGTIAAFVEGEAERIAARAVDVTGADAYELGQIAVDILSSDVAPIETVPLGVPMVDDALGGGAQVGRLTIVSAGTGVGKTTFKRHFMRAALDAKYGVASFGFESDRREETRGMVALYAGVRMTNSPKTMSRSDHARLMEAAGIVSSLPLWIEDESSMTIEDLTSRIRVYRRKHDVRVVFVDYVQDVEPTPGVFGASHVQLARVSKGLRKIAKQEGVAVIGFSQVSPPPPGEKRQLASDDTAGSKQFAKDAAAVVIIERNKEAEDERLRNLNRVRLSKNREFGKLVEAWMLYDAKTTRLHPASANGEPVTTLEVTLDVPEVDDD